MQILLYVNHFSQSGYISLKADL